jgi:ATP-binding cassette subfamily F protein uup
LSYKLQRELDELPGLIDSLEKELAKLEGEVASPEFHQRAHEDASVVYEALSEVQGKLDKAFVRWGELEGE